MAGLKYNTISAELAEYVDLAVARARREGYRVVAEPTGAYFPISPTAQGRSGQRELIIEGVSKVSYKKSNGWLAYGRAQRGETRVLVIGPPQKKSVPIEEIQKFQDAGIGLSVGNAGRLVDLVQPRDLSTHIVCPDISNDPRRIQTKLSPCFGKVERGDIVDGFKDVAVVVEQAARRHLEQGVSSGRIAFASKKGAPISYAVKDIRKGTMGWLRDRFGEIVKPNGIDVLILQTFTAVTPDRNIASHTELTPAKRRAMHARIAKHLLVLHQAARLLL